MSQEQITMHQQDTRELSLSINKLPEAESLETRKGDQDLALRLCSLCREQIIRCHYKYDIDKRTLDCSDCPVCQLIIGAFPENDSPRRTILNFSGRNFIIEPDPIDGDESIVAKDGNLMLLGTLRIEHDINPRPSEIPETINFSMVSGWLAHCRQQHRKRCDSRELSPRHFTPLEVIFVDVVQKCLCYGTTKSSYFALSYVWGSAITSTTTRQNLAALMRPGSLTNDLALPKTVSDAITLAREMGARFIWIDCLCIVQDSDEKYRDINNMDIVFSQAVLTIVACSGQHADSGLPGVESRMREQRKILRKQGNHILAVELPSTKFSMLRETTYRARGWTFQEILLSQRILFITGQQFSFHCNTSKRSESTIGEEGHDHREYGHGVIDLWSTKTFQREDSHILSSYNAMIMEYTGRRLTYDTDIEHAFAGLVPIVEQWCGGCPMVHGMMSNFLAVSMLWAFKENQADNSHYSQAEIGRRRPDLPSWSGFGWTACITNIACSDEIELPMDSLVSNIAITTFSKAVLPQHLNIADRSAQHLNVAQVTQITLVSEESNLAYPPMKTFEFEGQRTDWANFTVDSSKAHPIFVFKQVGAASACGFLSVVPDQELTTELFSTFEGLVEKTKHTWSLVRMYYVKLKVWDRVNGPFEDILEDLVDSGGAETGFDKESRKRLQRSRVIFVILIRRQGIFWERMGSGLMFAGDWPSTRERSERRAYDEKIVLI